MRNKLIKKSGETLIEAIVSITVLMMAGSIASSMIISAIQQSALSEDYLIAQNLAMEVVEGIKNIRDTNTMLYPDYPECWMVLDPNPDPLFDCTINPQVEQNRWYIVNYEVNPSGYGRWLLKNTADPDTSPDEKAKYQLYLKDDGTIKRYLHIDPPAPPEATASKFYREIKFDDTLPLPDSWVSFDVRVVWTRAGRENVFLLSKVVLTNY
ncbi:MAG: hypothetical protein WC269_04525 [Candidatus Gracilibacteria bacterium]|jgi:hypothetical protein